MKANPSRNTLRLIR